MNCKLHKLLAMTLVLALAIALAVSAWAHPVPDLERKGSITITMRFDQTLLTTGALGIYRVGAVFEDDGNYSFRLTGDFADSGVSLEDVTSADLPIQLAHYLHEHPALEPMLTRPVGEDGTVAFRELELGLYLVAQPEASQGFYPITPFMVSLPYLSEGEYCYDLTAGPKAQLEQKPTPTTPPTNPTGPDIPQTGLLWWPVPLLACGGMVLVLVGIVLKRRHKE